MTIAIYRPAQERHRHMHRMPNLLTRIRTWLFGDSPMPVHIGATETLPVIDAVLIEDPLDPQWTTYEPDKERALIGDALSVETPVVLDRGTVPWIDEFTTWFRTIPVGEEDEQKALTAGTGGTR